MYLKMRLWQECQLKLLVTEGTMMNTIKKNFLYNVAYQILVMLMPLITTPYISRCLGSQGIGNYSYAYSISSYYVMFIMLGLNNYGNRAIAKSRDDVNLLRKTFW